MVSEGRGRRGGRWGSHGAAAVRRGWRYPRELSGSLCLYEEPSRPAAGHHLTGVETGPPRQAIHNVLLRVLSGEYSMYMDLHHVNVIEFLPYCCFAVHIESPCYNLCTTK